jgi:hypothetical protein
VIPAFRLGARRLARAGQLGRIEKAPLNRARHSMHQARADAGSRRLLLDRRRDLGQKLRSSALVDRRARLSNKSISSAEKLSGIMGGSGREVATDDAMPAATSRGAMTDLEPCPPGDEVCH